MKYLKGANPQESGGTLVEGSIDLVKRKRISTEQESEKPIEVKTSHIEEVVMEEGFWKVTS